MRRTLAAVVALSLCALQVQALAFHVHAAPAHEDEHEHRHGPAIHHHDDDHHADRPSSSGPALADHSDSVDDVIAITVPSATAFAADVVYAESGGVLSLQVLQPSARVMAIEVRSHGPPAARSSLLRGPPPSPLP